MMILKMSERSNERLNGTQSAGSPTSFRFLTDLQVTFGARARRWQEDQRHPVGGVRGGEEEAEALRTPHSFMNSCLI